MPQETSPIATPALCQPDRIVTYSPAYTIVPTYECFNRCSYCNFRADPGAPMLELDAAAALLDELDDRAHYPQRPIEILILSGEVHPDSPRRTAWFQRIYDLCALAIDRGFLPHTNAGPLQRSEMAALKQVNVSMGLMLEQLTPHLLDTVHRRSPSKLPATRLAQLELAGELQIPFTTGLLLGIGETHTDRLDTLDAIARLHDRWQHIQEVILQPHSPGHRQDDPGLAFDLDQLPDLVAIARQRLPDTITIQIPPNLIRGSQPRPDILLACLDAGARDLGGLSPRDEVNPDYDHPTPADLDTLIRPHHWQLRPRLPVYPHYRPCLNSHPDLPMNSAIANTIASHRTVH
jgi:FO synthase subunit 1